ncbi:MAG: DNA-binding protein WhiA [Bacilli bacterium]|nr:DNA-binding protein WhiA [Bacilli bacterium]
MSYTITIKEEISNIESTPSEIIAELSGYIRNNSIIEKNLLKITTENKFSIDHILQSIKKTFDIDGKMDIVTNLNFSKKPLYQISFPINNNLLKQLGIEDENNQFLETVPKYIVGGNEEIRGYLRGVFSSVGSINDPKTSRYHMELMIPKKEEAVFVQKLLNLFELNAKILAREKGYMIYIKEAEKISDFLKIIKANKAVMYFEDIRVYHDKKNNTNRLNNMEQANMDKVILTASKELEDIKIIEENDGLTLLDDKVKEVITYRKKYKEASRKELAEIISMETNKSITKSGLNHRLRKVKELADNFRKMKKKEEQ